MTPYHNPLQHHHTKFFAAVPTSYADAVLKYGSAVVNCEASEWEARPIEANAAWLIGRLEQLNKNLRMSLKSVNKQLDGYRAQHARTQRQDSDHLPYEEDDR